MSHDTSQTARDLTHAATIKLTTAGPWPSFGRLLGPPAFRRPQNRTLKLEVRYCVGAVASPLLANIALSALDEHFAERWDDRVERAKRRRHGLPNYRLIRYADDFVVMVSGTKAHAQAVQDEVAAVLSPIGL
ncbi:MAG: reverse transcriptase domain-containing protein, partial [Solirubrobacteraceae bacterium]